MRILTVAAAKGGSGKSTIAQGLAVCAEQARVKTVLVDIDPQGSSVAWSRRRADALGSEHGPFALSSSPENLEVDLAQLKSSDYRLAVIDTPGTRGDAVDPALRACALALVPTAPTIFDLEAVLPTARNLSRLGRPFAFVLTSCPLYQQRRSQAEELLNRLAARAGEPIRRRVAYQDAAARGLGVTEGRVDPLAAAEMRALWAWVDARLGLVAP